MVTPITTRYDGPVPKEPEPIYPMDQYAKALHAVLAAGQSAANGGYAKDSNPYRDMSDLGVVWFAGWLIGHAELDASIEMQDSL